MALAPKKITEFSEPHFWDNFFKKRGVETFEWYGEYPELCGLLHKYIKFKDKLLVIGCGNSQLSSNLYDAGFYNITNIDISDIVITQMNEKNNSQRPRMKFLKMDTLETTFPNDEFTVVIDKGTLDALVPQNTENDMATAKKLFEEVARVLRFGGRYLCISLSQDFILKKMLDYFTIQGWFIRIHRVPDASQSGHSSHFHMPLFMFVCTKIKKMSNNQQILELAFEEEKIQRVSSIDFMLSEVKAVQQFSTLRHWLNTGSRLKDSVALELYNESSNLPRYILHVVDIVEKSSHVFAVFIVPQGREMEWLFSSDEGRLQLAKMAGYSRLVVVSLSRDHEYTNLDSINSELSSKVMDLAPLDLNPRVQVPFLSVGESLGSRTICSRGQSELSGEFVVEDVSMEDGSISRRLIFLNNQNVIQSEARLIKAQNRKKGSKETRLPRIDYSYLACQHHAAMVAGLAFLGEFTVVENQDVSILLIGLGGGGLPVYLHHWYQKVHLDVVEIDPAVVTIATEWFGFKEDERMNVQIVDGIDFIRDRSLKENSVKYDLVMFDVDSKEISSGMSCPPKCFVEKDMLLKIKTLLSPKGVFILNLVCRRTALRDEVFKDLMETFPTVCSKRIEEEVNEIFYALTHSDIKVDKKCKNNIPNDIVKNMMQLNLETRKKTHSNRDFVDIQDMIATLKITNSSTV